MEGLNYNFASALIVLIIYLFTTLITTFGVIENANKLNNIDQVVVLDDLFC